jgi:membrane protease YdiL (CAAX protease family)
MENGKAELSVRLRRIAVGAAVMALLALFLSLVGMEADRGKRRSRLRRSQMARSSLGITVGVFGLILIVSGLFILVVYGGFYTVPPGSIVTLAFGLFLLILGLCEDLFAAERKGAGGRT